MLRNGLGNTIKYSFEIIQLVRLLYLHNDNLIFAISCLDVNTVELVTLSVLVAFALKNLNNLDRLAYQNRHQSFKNNKIGFITQHTLGSPIETDIPIGIIHVISSLKTIQSQK